MGGQAFQLGEGNTATVKTIQTLPHAPHKGWGSFSLQENKRKKKITLGPEGTGGNTPQVVDSKGEGALPTKEGRSSCGGMQAGREQTFRKILWQIGPHHNHKVTLEVPLEASGRLGVTVAAAHLERSPTPDQTSAVPSNTSVRTVLYNMYGFHQNLEVYKCKNRQSERIRTRPGYDTDVEIITVGS